MSPASAIFRFALERVPLGLLFLSSLSSCAIVPDCGCVKNPEHAGCVVTAPEPPPQLTYVRAEGRYDSNFGTDSAPEITETPSYSSARTSVASAVIRAPDSCLNETAAQVSGKGDQSNAILGTKCGVWMKELEQALTHAQFRVISWQALRGVEQSQNLPSHQAAQRLGAEILFTFNSLEVSEIKPQTDSAQRVEYYASNDRGEKLGPLPLAQADRDAIRGAVKVKMGGGGAHVAALSSTLSCSAQLTATGEAVWHYQNTKVKPVLMRRGRAFLFVKHENLWHFATPAIAEVAVQVVPSVDLSAVDVDENRVEQQVDAYQKEKLELVRAVAQDLTDRFRRGSNPQ
jgi:hypothetical protein